MATNSSKSDRIWMDYRNEGNIRENYTTAAMMLRDKLKWDGLWVGGDTPDGMVFVCTESDCQF